MTDMIDKPNTLDGIMILPLKIPPLWLLGLLTFTNSVAMHIFVPALPIASKDLGAGIGAMQLTISLYILGLALGQLIYGPVSDRFGRRPTLMAGLILYTAASVMGLLAPNVDVLIVARFLQAFGGSAGMVLARAIVRDTSAPRDAARRLALMNLMVTIGPGLAPIVGSLLAPTFGWRSLFILLCVLGIANYLLSWRLLPETKPDNVHSAAAVVRHYGQLLRSPAFLGYAFGGGFATTSLYAYVTSAPFIFGRELHRPSYEVGVYLGILTLGIWLGAALASRLIARISIKYLLVFANAVSVAAALVLAVSVLVGQPNTLVIVAATFVFATGAGTASPAALTQAMGVNPHSIGSASGFYGFAQMIVGAGCTELASLGHDSAAVTAIILATAAIAAQASFWIAIQREHAGAVSAAT